MDLTVYRNTIDIYIFFKYQPEGKQIKYLLMTCRPADVPQPAAEGAHGGPGL